MSEADNPATGQSTASAEFAKVEQQLAQETSVLGLMKEQMTSMLGMVTMFIVTIVLALSQNTQFGLLYMVIVITLLSQLLLSLQQPLLVHQY